MGSRIESSKEIDFLIVLIVKELCNLFYINIQVTSTKLSPMT